jgi:hypothetical protein
MDHNNDGGQMAHDAELINQRSWSTKRGKAKFGCLMVPFIYPVTRGELPGQVMRDGQQATVRDVVWRQHYQCGGTSIYSHFSVRGLRAGDRQPAGPPQ